MKHIAVIGAGITGVTTAYSLLNRGFQVTVFDRNRYAAMQTSFANGGQLSASNAEVWTSMGTLFKGLRWMVKKDAPLLVNPRPSWHKYSWLTEFISHIPDYEANTIDTVRLAIAARQHLFEWAAQEGIEFDHERRGILHAYRNDKSFTAASKVNRLLEQGGLHRERVNTEQIRQLDPTLPRDLVGGYYTVSDSTGDIHKFTRGLADACTHRGAEFIYEASVEQLRHLGDSVEVNFSAAETSATDQRRYDAVVICAGIESRALAAQLGDRVNIYPVKGYSITVHLNDAKSQAAAPKISLLDDDAKIVTSRLGADRLRIAGTAEFNGINYDIRDDRIQPLVRWCRQWFPAVNTDQITPWAGLRPMLPSMLPRVGAGQARGVFYNTGHGHLGWTLSAATAEMIGDIVQGSLPATKPLVTTPVAQQQLQPTG